VRVEGQVEVGLVLLLGLDRDAARLQLRAQLEHLLLVELVHLDKLVQRGLRDEAVLLSVLDKLAQQQLSQLLLPPQERSAAHFRGAASLQE